MLALLAVPFCYWHLYFSREDGCEDRDSVGLAISHTGVVVHGFQCGKEWKGDITV